MPETENPQASAPAPRRRKRATRIGVVVSNKMQKSVVVSVERVVMHPLYRRTMRRSTKYVAHAEGNQCQIGDRILIEECRPLSKRKRWIVKRILGKQAPRGAEPLDAVEMAGGTAGEKGASQP